MKRGWLAIVSGSALLAGLVGGATASAAFDLSSCSVPAFHYLFNGKAQAPQATDIAAGDPNVIVCNGTSYVPIRYVARALGAAVSWDQSTLTASITTGAASTTTPPASSTTSAPPAPTSLLDVSGSGSKSTQTFTAPANWNLNWSYDCSKFLGGTGNFQVYIYNADGTLNDATGVNQLGASGSDTEYYHNAAGSLYLVVNSECSWTVVATAA